MTGPDTRFVIGRRGGSDVDLDFDPASVALYRGEVSGYPGSRAFLSASARGVVGTLDLGDAVGRYHIRGDSSGAVQASRSEAAGGLSPSVAMCGADTGGASRTSVRRWRVAWLRLDRW